jgi:ubiquitin-protein ligase
MGQLAMSSTWVLVSEYEGASYVSVYEEPSSSKVIGSIASGVKAQLKSVDEASGCAFVAYKHLKGWIALYNIHRLHSDTLDFSSLASVSASKPSERLTSEIKQLSEMSFAKHGMTVRVPKGVEHPNVIVVYIQGPPQSEYCECTFEVKVSFPEEFPEQAPSLQFLSPIYHPNISQAGHVCLDALGLGWSSTSNKESVGVADFVQFEGHAEVRVFDKPDANRRIIGTIPSHIRGTVSVGVSAGGDFVLANALGLKGWVGIKNVKFLQGTQDEESLAEVVNSDGYPDVRIFDKPDEKERKVIGTLPNHTRGKLLQEVGFFYEMSAGDLTGWVGAKNVKILKEARQDSAANDSPSKTCTSVRDLLQAARDLLASPKEVEIPLNAEAHELFKADRRRFSLRLEEETYKSTDFKDFRRLSTSTDSTRSSITSSASLSTSLGAFSRTFSISSTMSSI